MKNNNKLIIALLILVSFSLTGCELIADIFKAGVWVGIIIVLVVIFIIFWIIRKVSK